MIHNLLSKDWRYFSHLVYNFIRYKMVQTRLLIVVLAVVIYTGHAFNINLKQSKWKHLIFLFDIIVIKSNKNASKFILLSRNISTTLMVLINWFWKRVSLDVLNSLRCVDFLRSLDCLRCVDFFRCLDTLKMRFLRCLYQGKIAFPTFNWFFIFN